MNPGTDRALLESGVSPPAQGGAAVAGFSGRAVLMVVAMLLATRTFQYFPGMTLVQELAFVLAPLSLLVIAFRLRRFVGLAWAFEGLAIAVMIFMPIWSGLAASREFGQPVVFGVLAWRGFGLIAISLALLYAMRAGWIRVDDVGRAIVAGAWITVVIYLVMSLLLDPADFTEYGLGFVEDRHLEGFRFKFNGVLPIYAMFHYGVRAYRESRPELYLLAGVFAAFLFGSAGGRILTVSVVLTLLLVLWHWGGLLRIAKGGLALAVVLAVILGFGLVFAPEATAERLDKFRDAFAVFATEADFIDDISAASRALQLAVAMPLIEAAPWVGSGRISSQWVEQGFAGYLGAYFFADDIGIAGTVLQFGILGTVLFGLQFVFAWIYARRIRRPEATVVSDTCELYVAYLAVSSIATGVFVSFPEVSFLMVTILARQAENHG